ncbi:MAG TPA: hypothetical protein VNJ08_17825 [Bacteriovoracaceae bacterium]|nr:hypothetical protein [Bacteriovoracaceae bacterium]
MIKVLLFLALMPVLASAKTISKSGIEAYLDSYFQKQITQDLSNALPEARFSLHVRTGLNDKLLVEKSVSAPMKLPLGGSFLLEEEANTTPGEVASLQHPESYRDALKSVNVELAWNGDLPEDVKEWLKNYIMMNLRLSPDVVHNIKITAMPAGFEKKVVAPAPEASPVAAPVVERKVGWLERHFTQLEGISSHESAALLLVAALAVFSLVGFALKIFLTSGQYWGFSKVFKDGMSKISDSLVLSTPSSVAPSATLSKDHSQSSATRDKEQVRAWVGVQIPELRAFAYDCLEHALYESAAIIVTHHFIDASKAQELKAELPAHFFDVDGPGRVLAPAHEIEQLFFHHRLQYVLLAERPLVQALMSYSVPQCLRMVEQYITEKKSVEALSVINRLTPIKREMVSEQLELPDRLKLATWALDEVNHDQLEKVEAALAKSLSRPMNTAVEAHTVQFPFKTISTDLFKARGFKEDEAIHNWCVDQGKASHSIIAAISLVDQSVWGTLPLNEVALAYFGHSEDVLNELLGNFDQKRQDWLKNFIQKYTLANLAWESPEAVQARLKIIRLLPLDRSQSSEDNKEDEPPLQLFKAA